MGQAEHVPRKPDHWVYLLAEVDAAASLLRRARLLWFDYNFAIRDAEPLIVLMATGTEKLLKLTFGLLHEEVHGSWPSWKVLATSGYGHDVERLDQDLRKLIRTEAGRATHTPYVFSLLDAVDADANLPLLLRTLATYGMRGRFYNLDHLLDNPVKPESPAALWNALVDGAALAHPELDQLLGAGPEAFDRLRSETNAALLGSLDRWQDLYARTWIQGVCGGEAKAHGFSLLPRT